MGKKICWPVFLYLIGYHVFILVSIPIYLCFYTPSLGLLLTSFALVFISGLSITAGYHRLYSHLTYKTNSAVEAVLLFFASMATQGSALRWCHDHRLHHAYVDTDKDPYSVKKGLFHAHMLWMLFQSKEIDPKVISDLSRKKLLVFQHKYYPYCMLVSNIVAFLIVGAIFNDYLGAFLFAWWVRLFCLHHTTWCINSLAHYWGTKMYSREHSAVDNYMISLLTYGEGYHNFHHTFAHDYRNGIRWYHFDPTKWVIWTLYKLGLAYDLRKVNDYRIARQLIQDHKERLIRGLKESFYAHKEHWEGKITEISTGLMNKLSELQTLLEKYKTISTQDIDLLRQIRSIKKSLKQDWKQWRVTIKMIYKTGLRVDH